MGVPAEAIGYATDYLRIIALGIPFLSVYNFYSAVIKAGGDSRTPIQDLSVSRLMNIVLDYVFVAQFRLGIQPDFKYVRQIFRLGITGIVQNGASAIRMFFIQGAITSLASIKYRLTHQLIRLKPY